MNYNSKLQGQERRGSNFKSLKKIQTKILLRKYKTKPQIKLLLLNNHCWVKRIKSGMWTKRILRKTNLRQLLATNKMKEYLITVDIGDSGENAIAMAGGNKPGKTEKPMTVNG